MPVCSCRGKHVHEVRDKQLVEGALDGKPAARGNTPVDDVCRRKKGGCMCPVIVHDAAIPEQPGIHSVLRAHQRRQTRAVRGADGCLEFVDQGRRALIVAEVHWTWQRGGSGGQSRWGSTGRGLARHRRRGGS